MKLAVGFLTYNDENAKYLADFLPSLEAALGFLAVDDYQVYAFDNSQPGNQANRLALEAWNQGSSQSHLWPRRPLEYLTAKPFWGRAPSSSTRPILNFTASRFLTMPRGPLTSSWHALFPRPMAWLDFGSAFSLAIQLR